MNSVIAFTKYFSSVLERYEYDACGNCYVMDASYNPRTKSSYGNPFYFTGRELDLIDNRNLKVYNYRHRYYDTYTGRFTTHDPLGITPNAYWPNRFVIIGQYKDGMNVYEYVGSNPVLQNDPWGLRLISIGRLPIRLIICPGVRNLLSQLLAFRRMLHALGFPPLGASFGAGHPYQHCIWSCNMTRGVNRSYAQTMGALKEALDNAVADWADGIGYCKFSIMETIMPTGWGISDWVCSAGQTADDIDNAAGMDCGDQPQYRHLSCARCCKTEMDIWPDTEEGTVERPFGPRCHGRYKDQVEKNLGREVVVEDSEVRK